MYIASLQGLRALAFFGIFLSHAKMPFAWSTLSVSIFFVLSGFLLYYRDRINYSKMPPFFAHSSLINNIIFSIKKIKKLYKLHIITMILVIPLCTLSIGTVATIFLNIVLLQCWGPLSSINVSLNGVAWYLSTIMFLYFMFPYIKK